jgi:hypothetical protein
MTDSPEAIAERNRQYYEEARTVLRRAAATIRHFSSYSKSGMKFTCDATDLDNPPAEHRDGTELADGAFYFESWGTKPHADPVGMPDGSTQTVVENYWIRAVYRADGSLEVHSREGDILIEDAEVGPGAACGRITPVRAVVLRGQQGFGRKGFSHAFAAAISHPVVVLETETVRPSDFELDEPTPYDDRRW